MAAEAPNQPGQPAAMPQTSEVATTTYTPADASQSTSSLDAAPTQSTEATSQETGSHEDAEVPKNDEGANAWFSQDDHDEGDAWLASDEPASEEQPAQELPTEQPAEQPTEQPTEQPAENPEQDAAEEEPTASTPQHSKRLSFARTVSHEVSFGDDEDGDWNPPRTDIDPFKFMSPSDRTNSFPVVPPMAKGSDSHHALPSNQAFDLMEEDEKDATAEEQEYQRGQTSGSPAELSAPKRSHARSVSIGRDLPGADAQASEERYEEGLPLISQPEADETAESRGAAAASFDDDDNGDDFFGQAQDSHSDEPEIQPLQRKSTMQVMDSADPITISRQDGVEETIVEESDEEEEAEGTDKNEGGEGKPTADLASKWEAAFADDDEDEFLVEDASAENKEVDPAAFFGSDDEGFLEDEDEAPASQPAAAPAPIQTTAKNPYAPQQGASAYTPTTPTGGYNAPAPITTPYGSAPQYGTAPPAARPGVPRAQSYADKSKGGYSSPYDLPSDLVTPVVKPRKRASMQQLPRSTPPPPQVGPPRSASASNYGPAPPSTTLSPPSSSHGQGPPTHQGPPQHKPPTPGGPHKENFFEDLPMASRPRPTSRTSIRAPSPAQQPPMAYGVHPPVTSAAGQMPPPPLPTQAHPPQSPATQPAGVAGLVAPERVSPYASLSTPANHMPPPSTNVSRYSPAPGATGNHAVPPAAANSRYSPAPPATKSHASYGPVAAAAVPPPVLPHQPRTSSPLTHVETNHNGETLAERRMSSSYEPRLNRVSSLPPTREVDEEDEQQSTPNSRSLSATHAPIHYSPRGSPTAIRRTPPPPSYAGQLTLSPPKQSNYMPHIPHGAPTAQAGFVPPPRAQTQSPSASFGHRQSTKSSDSTKRPSSAHSPASPVLTKSRSTQAIYAPVTRTRGASLTMNMVAPTDGRENDPLQRWKGVPVFAWGVGGTIVTSFPNSLPRYGMNQSVPTIVRTPGEVKVRNIKDVDPLPERLGKFPGPLKGKSKKKEAIAWLSAGIEGLEKDLPEVSFHSQLSLEAKRAIERLLLWRILRVFIEHDGVLEGTPAVEKAVRDILSPGTITPTADDDALFPGVGGLGVSATSVTAMPADGADISTMDQVRHHLLRGDREKAVWALVDKRLWGHAMLISHTVSDDLYKQVAQEFVRKEVNYPGHQNESIAALYKILSGNYDDCVDELVPSHARAGLQLLSTGAGSGPTNDTLDGLDKWRETLGLVLSNRSTDDIRGLNALGSLLSSYGRAEAAHICFIFGRNASIFGGLDDPAANFVLVGSDHRQHSDQFGKDIESLQLSEVYEYGLSLAGGLNATAGSPHLAAYKLQHAMSLAEYGFRDKALQYCDAIAVAMTSQTKRSPYYNYMLESAVDDFMIRLKQAPKEETNSWISKPSMNKVSDSMWNRFNKFVAGDENEANGNGASGEGEAGPFGRITTPTMSRSPSVSNFEQYGGQSPGYPMGGAHAPMSGTASRYAPGAVAPTASSNPYEPASQYTPAPRSSMDRSSNEFTRNSYEPTYPGSNPTSAPSTSYAPVAPPLDVNAAQPSFGMSGAPGLAPAAQITQGYQPFGMQSPESVPAVPTEDHSNDSLQQGYQPPSYGYEPPSMTFAAPEPEAENKDNGEASGGGGYEAPSFQPYGYEPPSYEPDLGTTADDDDDAPKPKKKSFMDDDDDDIAGLKEKSKAEKDRENDEMFRKAAEEDAKRAAAQPAKKGWGFGGWFGGNKKAAEMAPTGGDASPGKPIRAKLGEASSFVYDPDLKRWVNKKPGAENTPAKAATPPPPKGMPRSVSGTPPPPSATPPPPMSSSVPPPSALPPLKRPGIPELKKTASMGNIGLTAPPPMIRSVSSGSMGASPSAPSSRPTTSMSNASSIDDLLGAAAPRKPGDKKKPRKSGRYVDVMAK